MHRGPKDAVTEHPRRERDKIAEVFIPGRLRLFAKEEVFEFNRRARAVAHRFGTLDNAAQHLARRDRQGRAIRLEEIDQVERRPGFPGKQTERREINPGQPIRIACVPAGVGCIIISYIGGIPSKNYIAKTGGAFTDR